MGKISSGEVTYGRTVKTGDYENKRADVKLYFTIDDGDKAETVLEGAAKEALTRVYAMVGLKLPGTEAKTETAALKEPKKEPTKQRTKADLEAEQNTKLGAAPKGEDLSFDEDAMTEEPEVTGEIMSAAMNKTVARLNKAKEGSGPKMVKALIATFVEPPKKSHDIPQSARHAFLKKLEELK